MALTKVSGNLIQQQNFSVGVVTATSITGDLTGNVTGNVTGDATGLSGTPDITVGVVTASSVTISGDLTVEGTYSTLDTILTEVDKLEVAANNSTVGVAITQSGTGDILNLYDGASEVFSVLDGGNVGIGLTNPTEKLEVNGNIKANGQIEVAKNSSFYVPVTLGDTGAGANEKYWRFGLNRSSKSLSIGTQNDASSAAYAAISINRVGVNVENVIFYTLQNNERLRITSTGNVGIGLTNPSKKLSVYTGSFNSDVALFTGANTDRGLVISTFQRASNDDSVDYNAQYSSLGVQTWSIAGSEKLRLDHLGNVGINSTSPGRKLTVAGGGTSLIASVKRTDGASAYLTLSDNSTTSDSYVGVGAEGDGLKLRSGNSDRVYVNSSGSVGINSDAPARTLDVHATSSTMVAQFRSSTFNNQSYICFANPASNADQVRIGSYGSDLIASTNYIERLRITSSGSVGIATTNPTETLHVEGNTRVTGILTVGQNSTSINGALEYPSIRPTLDLNFAATKTLDRRITFTRDSLGTYVDELGIVRTAPNNTPRFDHDPETGESLGLLIEESRTNLLTYSDLTSGEGLSPGWVNAGPVASKGTNVIAPDGTQTAWTTLYDGSSGDGALSRNGGEVATSNSTVYTYSIWAKVPSTNTYITGVRLRTYNDNHSANFNLLTGEVIGGSEGTTIPRIEAYPNDWYRCSITFTSGTDGDQGIQNYMLNNTSGSLNSSGANGEALYLWGAQLEAGSFPTSYIPTSGSTVTRATDFAKITGTNFTDFYNQTEGTFFVEADTINPVYNDGITGHDNNNNNYTIVGTGQSPNRFQLRFDDEEPFQLLAFGPNSTTAITTNVTLTPTLRAKIAGAFKQDYVRGAAQGEIILTDSTFDMISPTSLFIGSLDGSSEILPGHIRKVSYYRQALPNAQLQGLTQQ